MFHILVIEDNAADVHLLQLALEEAGVAFGLTVIEDGAAALSFIRHEGPYFHAPKPDLAVLDLNLPKVGGMEVLEALRHSSDMSSVPVAMVTSSSALHERNQAQELGVARFLTKQANLEGVLWIGRALRDVLLKT